MKIYGCFRYQEKIFEAPLTSQMLEMSRDLH